MRSHLIEFQRNMQLHTFITNMRKKMQTVRLIQKPRK